MSDSSRVGDIVKTASLDADLSKFLTDGGELSELQSSSKLFRRTFYTDEAFTVLKYDWSQCFIPRSFAINLDDISDVRCGTNTDRFNESHIDLQDDLCFSIVWQRKGTTNKESLDLVADSTLLRDHWVRALKQLMLQKKGINVAEQRDQWLKNIFITADKNKDRYLLFDEILKLLKNLNVLIDKEAALKLFQAADADKLKTPGGKIALDIDEFVNFYEMLAKRPEYEELVRKYGGNDGDLYLTAEELHNFLMKEQNVLDVTLSYCRFVMTKYEPCPNTRQSGLMGIDGFRTFMESEEMNVFNHNHRKVYQDMSQPLSHYYISSSHNTYLTKDQLIGPSSVEGYVNALKKGCRCVELDCWDGSDNEPIIYHGYTLTSEIKVRDVLDAVKLFAFEASEYPVILSIENHLSIEQQKVMAKYLKTILGDMVFADPVPDGIEVLPSPEQLKGKILIKDKVLPQSAYDGEVSEEDEAAEVEDEEVQRKVAEKKGRTLKRSPELSKMVNYIQSKSFVSFEHSKKYGQFCHNSSFAESKAFRFAEDETSDFIEYNRRQLVRTYPGGFRVDSSNHLPYQLWNVGCHIVAFNFQTMKKAMHVYLGKFMDNAGCGYVLKPEFLRISSGFNPSDTNAYDKTKKRYLTVKVISGSQIPKAPNSFKEIIDPYVKFQTYGVPNDCKKFETNRIDNNGFNPVWNETFETTIHVPELALVRFVVKDYDPVSSSDFVGQFCLPFTSLQKGYRTVHLDSKIGEPLFPASLLIHVNISSTETTEL